MITTPQAPYVICVICVIGIALALLEIAHQYLEWKRPAIWLKRDRKDWE